MGFSKVQDLGPWFQECGGIRIMDDRGEKEILGIFRRMACFATISYMVSCPSVCMPPVGLYPSVGLYAPLLDYIHLCWSVCPSIGMYALCKSVFPSVGLYAPLLVWMFLCWNVYLSVHSACPTVGFYAPLWVCMPLCGYVCPSVGMYAPLLVCMPLC